MLDAAFYRFSDDIDSRSFLLTAFHAVQLPRDSLSPVNSALSIIEYVDEFLTKQDTK